MPVEVHAAEQAAQVDWGFPSAGLFGSVDFDGHYCFGVYDEVLIHRHATLEWLATGPRLPGALNSLPYPVTSPNPNPDSEPAPLSGAVVTFKPELPQERYEAMVRRAQDYIAAGDIYQVNLAHAFSADWPEGADALAFARRLRSSSPAPYAAYLELGERQVISSSPESFLKMSGSLIRTRPIKGTRPRHRDAAADERSSVELLRSAKERAELLMITDLERNDLGQVCEYGSVRVTDLIKLERYEQVFHLVSTVQGTLRPGVSHPTALAACFPGGSITGAPKKRAGEIIAELEGRPRGLYTGAIGYFGANGESQFSIAIRTVVIQNGRAEFQAGAGIVADSVPTLEWEETLHKAAGILAAAADGGGHE
ncbi:MAG: anthranilate synthase component I family protein [Verrucomicrobiaceae bacterium]|nr:MAG: anthranilate synthase component I family protein [Verrucomicrobiaceae bacterium]